jgi:hypothetical protein
MWRSALWSNVLSCPIVEECTVLAERHVECSVAEERAVLECPVVEERAVIDGTHKGAAKKKKKG